MEGILLAIGRIAIGIPHDFKKNLLIVIMKKSHVSYSMYERSVA